MKSSLSLALLGLALSGCSTLPPATIDLENKVSGTYMTLQAEPRGDLGVRVYAGQTARIETSEFRSPGPAVVTAKLWDDRSGSYVGSSVMNFMIRRDDYGYFYEQEAVASYK